MQINLIKKKVSYKFIKFTFLPLEKIKFFFYKKYSKFCFISDNASWATDNTTNFIIKFFNKFNVDTIKIFHEPKNQFVFYTDQYSILKKNFFKYKNIVAIDYQHGMGKYLENNRKLLSKVKKFQKYIKLIRVTNSYFKKYLIKNGINKDKLFQIPLTVDTNFFKPYKNKKELRKKFNLPINKILIGSFHKDGNGWDDGLTPKLIKGPDIFIKTINEIKKKIGRDQFAVVLTAPARGYIKERLTKNSIEFFHFYPFQFSNLPELYNCLDLYLISSRDEGGPTGMFEAMACGIPVVSTKVGSAHDHIRNFYNGFKCEINDFLSLSYFSLKILFDLKLRKRVITNSLKTAKKNNFINHQKMWKLFFKKFQK
tara:strand:- start:38 stop:1141 length:1104 start_codon:yes stop_codon:yes gene_type:complete